MCLATANNDSAAWPKSRASHCYNSPFCISPCDRSVPRSRSGPVLSTISTTRAVSQRLDALFLARLEALTSRAARGPAARARKADVLAPKQESELLIALAPHLDDLHRGAVRHRERSHARWRRATTSSHRSIAASACSCSARRCTSSKRTTPPRSTAAELRAQARARCSAANSPSSRSRSTSRAGRQDEAAHATELDLALRYAAWAALTPGRQSAASRRRAVQGAAQARLPAPGAAGRRRRRGLHRITARARRTLRRREGFKLTDPGTDLTGALDQAHYCIWCHEQGKDSCSKGCKEKGASGRGERVVQEKPFRRHARRLPARRKNLRVSQGQDRRPSRSARSPMIVVDNPMVRRRPVTASATTA